MQIHSRTLIILSLGLIAGLIAGFFGGQAYRRTSGLAPLPTTSSRQSFVSEGKPIHPAVIRALMCPLANTAPFTRAVDVAAFDDSDAYELGTESGRTTASRLDSQHVRTVECIAYTHVGLLPGGVHLLDVSECGGGSCVFRSLLLVRLEDVAQRSLIDGRPRALIMSSVAQISLGDRNNARVSVSDDGVVIQGKLEGELFRAWCRQRPRRPEAAVVDVRSLNP